MKVVRWKQIDWEQVNTYINRLQMRIVKAVQENKWRLVKRLQYLITHSFYGKALAIKRVISNKGKKTPGIDGIVWKSDKDKETAIQELQLEGYRAKPLRRIYIEKFGKKEKRPLGIPTMKDRAMQALQLLGLEPIAETIADTESFGFRKFRSAQDAMEYSFSILCRKDSPQWILEGDIKGCFDNISHEWLQANIPMDKRILKEFMRCGFIYQNKLFPTETGTPQGGIISPTLANITLDGMERLIKEKYWSNAKGTIDVRNNKKKVHLVRYADDFVVTGTDIETLEEIRDLLKEFLAQRGLVLSEEKTKITSIQEGYDFLGWNFRKYRGKMIIKPSNKSVHKVRMTISNTIRNNKTSTQANLIYQLNQVMRGWVNYFGMADMKSLLVKTDEWLRHKIRANYWKHWKKIKTRYRKLKELGMREEYIQWHACMRQGIWNCSNNRMIQYALNNAKLRELGYPTFTEFYLKICEN